jgi:hypothetical protein
MPSPQELPKIFEKKGSGPSPFIAALRYDTLEKVKAALAAGVALYVQETPQSFRRADHWIRDHRR